MNIKLAIGRLWSSADETIKGSRLGLVYRYYPWGRDFVFDLRRLFSSDINCIIDAGANVGSVSKAFSKWFPAATVYAFEPIKATFQILTKRVAAHQKIQPVHAALGEASYEVEVAINSEDTINSISAPPSEENTIGKEVIAVTTLDDYIQQQQLPNPDILKIDVEGYEFKVLAGAKNVLSSNLKAIVLEVGYERGPGKVHFSEVEDFMEKQGFQCCGIYDLSKSKDKRRLYYSNNLYIRKELI